MKKMMLLVMLGLCSALWGMDQGYGEMRIQGVVYLFSSGAVPFTELPSKLEVDEEYTIQGRAYQYKGSQKGNHGLQYIFEASNNSNFGIMLAVIAQNEEAAIWGVKEKKLSGFWTSSEYFPEASEVEHLLPKRLLSTFEKKDDYTYDEDEEEKEDARYFQYSPSQRIDGVLYVENEYNQFGSPSPFELNPSELAINEEYRIDGATYTFVSESNGTYLFEKTNDTKLRIEPIASDTEKTIWAIKARMTYGSWQFFSLVPEKQTIQHLLKPQIQLNNHNNHNKQYDLDQTSGITDSAKKEYAKCSWFSKNFFKKYVLGWKLKEKRNSYYLTHAGAALIVGGTMYKYWPTGKKKEIKPRMKRKK